MQFVRDRFRVLLTAGAQVRGLPDGKLAAGQFLNDYDFAQRGLFGTAAALRVLGDREGITDLGTEDLEKAGGLVGYLSERADVERACAAASQGSGEPENLEFRLSVEARDTFKAADILYALAHVSGLVPGRDELLRVYVEKLKNARLSSGGWDVRLDAPEEVDLLASAHVLRALHAAGAALERSDVEALERAIQDNKSNDFVRIFLILTVLHVGTVSLPMKEIRNALGDLWGRYQSRFDTPSEANYEYKISDRPYYVRVPWQIYLLSCFLRAKMFWFLTHARQRVVLEIAQALASDHGYVYEELGAGQSTRTYGVVFDFFQEVREFLEKNAAARTLSNAINTISRIVRSRALLILLWSGSAALILWSVWKWITKPDASVAELASNFVAGFLVYVLSELARRIR